MKKELTKEDLIEEIVKVAKEDDTFMCKVEKAIEESKIISTIEANFMAAHIADIFKLNVDPNLILLLQLLFLLINISKILLDIIILKIQVKISIQVFFMYCLIFVQK